MVLLNQTKSLASVLNVNVNSRIYFLDSDAKLHDIFKYSPQDNLTLQEIGSTASTDFPTSSAYIWERRSNLSSLHLNVIYVDYPLLTMGHNDSKIVRGYYGDVFHSLQEKYGFSYKLQLQRDKVYGSRQKNGSYTGMFGKIQRGDSNWSIADCTENEERLLTFDFSNPVITLPKRIITRKSSEEFDTYSYFAVFSQQFWICLGVSAVVLVVSIYFALRSDE